LYQFLHLTKFLDLINSFAVKCNENASRGNCPTIQRQPPLDFARLQTAKKFNVFFYFLRSSITIPHGEDVLTVLSLIHLNLETVLMVLNRGRFAVVQPHSTYLCTVMWRYYKMLNLKIGGFSVVGGETMHLSVPVRNLLWRRIIQLSQTPKTEG